jgi:hypothetical protein
MSNVQVQVHPRIHLDQVKEVQEVRGAREVVANMPIAEREQCVVVVVVAALVAVAVAAVLVVVVEESGCWCEKMHQSSEAAAAAAAEEVDGFIRVALVEIANLASHLCLSHL